MFVANLEQVIVVLSNKQAWMSNCKYMNALGFAWQAFSLKMPLSFIIGTEEHRLQVIIHRANIHLDSS